MKIAITLKDAQLQIFEDCVDKELVAPNGVKLLLNISDTKVSIANFGKGFGGPQKQEYVPFINVLAAVKPGYEPWGLGFYDYRRVPELDVYVPGLEVWSLIDEKIKPAKTLKYAESGQYHIFGGGEIWEWAFVSEFDYNPFTIRDDKEKSVKFAELINLQNLQDPRLMDVLRAMTIKVSPTYTGINNLGDWVYGPTFVKRWPSIKLEDVSGPYHAGDIQSAGEGHTNSHYNLWGFALINAIINDDKDALMLGLQGIWRKCQFGLYHTNNPTQWIDGIWRGEKSATGGVRGDGAAPAPSKQFDLELVLAWLICDNELINRAFNTRKHHVKTSPLTWWWDRNSGERMIARFFDSTLAFYIATGEVVFRDRAQAMLAHIFANYDPGSYIDQNGAYINPKPPVRGPFWTSIYKNERNFVRPWEAGKLFSAIYRWFNRDPDMKKVYKDRVNNSLRWYWENAVRFRISPPIMLQNGKKAVEVAYRYDVSTNQFNPAPYDIGNPVHCNFWVPLIPVLKELFPSDVEKIDGLYESAMSGILKLWSDLITPVQKKYEFSPGSIGAAADKINGMALSMMLGL